MKAPNEFATLQAFHRQWNGGAPIVEEAEKHRFTDAFVSQVLVPKDPRWGRKSRAAGAGPISKDTVAYWLGATIPSQPTDGQVDARDLLTSAGADSWNSDDDPAYNNIPATWYPVAAASVASPPAAVQTPIPTPQTPPQAVNVEELLAGLETRLCNRLDRAIGQLRADLQAALDALPSTTAPAVNAVLDQRLSEIQSSIASAVAGLPKEYELRSLGRVIGTLSPKS